MTRPALILALLAAPALAHHDHPPLPTPRPWGDVRPAAWAGPAEMPCGDPWREGACE